MKKFMYFAAALLVLVGCNKKDNTLNNAPEGTPFEKGQQVTLTVGAGAQQGPNRVAGVENTTDNQIDFKWEENDQILVKVGDKTAEFTLTTGEGTETGTFSGVMPASGTTFDIQYPIEEPALSAQVYTTTKTIPADKMLFTATNCTLGNNATLQAQYAMLQLNLYGENKTIGKIVVTDITNIFDASEPVRSAMLTCTSGVKIGDTEDAATPFYMVVPAGEYRFEVRIWNNAATPAKLAWFGTSADKTFTAGNCLNMPTREVKVERTYVDLGAAGKWATVNIEDVAPEDHGKTYQYSAEPSLGIDERWPEKADFDKLVSFYNKKWVENFLGFGANGYLFINGNEYLFMPAAFDHDGSFWASDAEWSSAWTLYISNEPAIYTRTRGLQDGYLIRTMWEHYVN